MYSYPPMVCPCASIYSRGSSSCFIREADKILTVSNSQNPKSYCSTLGVPLPALCHSCCSCHILTTHGLFIEIVNNESLKHIFKLSTHHLQASTEFQGPWEFTDSAIHNSRIFFNTWICPLAEGILLLLKSDMEVFRLFFQCQTDRWATVLFFKMLPPNEGEIYV